MATPHASGRRLTPTFKVKRAAVYSIYHELFEDLYAASETSREVGAPAA